MAEIRNRATLDSTQFQAGLKDMSSQVQGLAQSMRSLPGIGGALSIAGLAAAARSAMNTADEIDNLSEQLGMGVEAVQAYKIGMEEAGLSINDLQSASDRLRSEQARAISGNEQARASFNRLGISMDDLRGANTERLLEMVGQSLHQNAGNADVTSASYDLMGRKAGRMTEVLIQMNKEGIQTQIDSFKRLGLIMDEEVIEKLNRAQLTVERFGKQAQNRFATVAASAGSGIEKVGAFFGALSAGESVGQAWGTAEDVVNEPFETAQKAKEERQQREIENRIAGEERAAQSELANLQEKRRLQQMTNDELRSEWNMRLEVAQAEKEQAKNARERVEALKRIQDAEEQLARIRDPIEREERGGRDSPASALRRIGGNLQGNAGGREQISISQKQLRTQENTWRVLQRIEQNMGTGATF